MRGYLKMQLEDPSIQDRVHGTVGTEIDAGAATPLLTAPDTILWLVFAGALLLFLVIIYLIMRGRVASATRYAEAAEKKFFQPAGEDAEINFDDHTAATSNAPDENSHNEATAEFAADDDVAEVIIEHPEAETGSVDEPSESEIEARKSRRRLGAFSGLFARRKKPSSSETDKIGANGALLAEDDDFEIDRSDPFAKMRGSLDFESDDQHQAGAARLQQDAQSQAEALRLKAQADADAIRLEAEENARRLAVEEQRRAAEREAEFERRKLALLQQQEKAVAQPAVAPDFQTTLSKELDDRFAVLSERLAKQAQESQSALSAAPSFISGGASTQNFDEITQKFVEHRESVDSALANITSRLNKIAAPQNVEALRTEIADLRSALRGQVAPPVAPHVQLGDIIRNALPPDSYEMNAILPNNRKADCVVRLPHPPGPIAIDARFPVEAYNELQQALSSEDESAHAENEFRRITLRHVVDIAERMIVPDETADSALMFVPSESIYTELHSRFPDVVQDSYRARVWIVSPTTLMATLHTVRAIVRDAQIRENATIIQAEAQQVFNEVEDLRRRVISLEETFDRTRSDVRDVISSTDQVYRRAETISRNGRLSLAEPVQPSTLPERSIPPTQEPAPAETSEGFYGAEASAAYLAPKQTTPPPQPNEPDLWENDKAAPAEPSPFPLR
ncbi:MAG: DNA recombination protein RmuC [Pseudomonadota bacterium]